MEITTQIKGAAASFKLFLSLFLFLLFPLFSQTLFAQSCAATDKTPPTVRCKKTRLVLDSMGTVRPRLDSINNGTTDNCGLDSLWLAPNFFVCNDPDSVVVTLFARDSAKNTASCSVKLPIVDTLKPKARCRPTYTVSLNDDGEAQISPRTLNENSWDNCALLLSLSRDYFNCKDVGRDIPIWFFARDSANNKDSCRVVISVSDNISPIARCKNVEIALNTEGVARLTPDMVDGGSSDNCQNLRFELPDSTFDCSKIGRHTVLLSVKDGAGNLALCQSQITVVNNQLPVARCRNTTVYFNRNGAATVSLSAVDAGSFSNCEQSRFLENTNFTCENGGVNLTTLVITDNQNREGRCTARVTALDTTSPVMRCRNATVFLDEKGEAALDFRQIDNGTTDNCGIESLILSKAAFRCADLGSNNLTLTAIDKSGNRGQCQATVTVRDTIPPSVFCPKDTSIQLPLLGCSAPATFDATANDNCTAVLSQTQGGVSGSVFGRGVNIVGFTATDFSGNASRCTFKINVLDPVTSGTLICKNNLTISLDQLCLAEVTPRDLLVGVDYRCFSSYQMRLSINNVSLPDNLIRAEQIGKILTGRVIDPVSNNSCTTAIRVVDNAPPVVEAARDTIISCSVANILSAPPPSELNQPRIVGECSAVRINHTDVPYDLPCNYNTRNRPFAFPDFVQYDSIKARNCVRVVWRSFIIEDFYKNTTVSHQVIYVRRANFRDIICPPSSIFIQCTNGLPLNLSPDTMIISGKKVPGLGRPRLRESSILPQNACGFSANFTDVTTTKDDGSYAIRRRWFISGGCESGLDSCIQNITVEDLRPVLTCRAANVSLTTLKNVRVGVSQLIEKVSDKCSAPEKLTLRLRRLGQGSGFPNDSSLVFTCANLGQNGVEVWVRDEAGFTAVCTTQVRIDDPLSACIEPNVGISGTIATPRNRAFRANLTLANVSINTQSTQSGATFNFSDVPRGQNYRLGATRTGDWRNGLTTADIEILMRHVLDLEVLTTPYEYIAADVDANAVIDVADAFKLRQLIFRRIDSISGSKSWFFVPKKYVFPAGDPIGDGFLQEYFFPNLRDSVRDADFVAVKSGDLNYSARETTGGLVADNDPSAVTRSAISPLVFTVKDRELKAGETVEMRLEVPDNQSFAGFQFGLKYDPSVLRLEKCVGAGFNAFSERENTHFYANENALGVSWNGKWQRGNALVLTFKTKNAGQLRDAVRLSDAVLEAEAFDQTYQTTGVMLNFVKNTVMQSLMARDALKGGLDADQLSVLGNFPNPFSDQTTLRFYSPNAQALTLTVYDMLGKLIFTKKDTATKGINEWQIDVRNGAAQGILLYQLSNGETRILGKMIKK